MNIGFIGTGKISSSLVEAICTSSLKDYRIFLSPRNKEKSIALEDKFTRVKRMKSNKDVLSESDIVFVALKPDVYLNILSELEYRADHIIVSLIPYTSFGILKNLCKPAKSVTRAIPLPAVITHNCPIPVFNPDDRVLQIFSNIGNPIIVEDENQLHALWALTGLITPYYDMLSELSKWASEKGVKKSIANKYVADMFSALSLMAGNMDNPDFTVLSDHAATPGGMNETAGKALNSAGTHQDYIKETERIFMNFKNHE